MIAHQIQALLLEQWNELMLVAWLNVGIALTGFFLALAWVLFLDVCRYQRSLNEGKEEDRK